MNAFPLSTPVALRAAMQSHNRERRAWLSDPGFQRFHQARNQRAEKRRELARLIELEGRLNEQIRELDFDLEHLRKAVRPENQDLLP